MTIGTNRRKREIGKMVKKETPKVGIEGGQYKWDRKEK